MNEIKKLADAIERALEKCPVSEVLSVLTGCFVGLTVELVRRQCGPGEDMNKPITIDGGKSRDITIHAPKDGAK